jgi:hypothetical protein
VRSRTTGESDSALFAALYIDRLDMHCFLGLPRAEPQLQALRSRLGDCLRGASVLDLVQMLRTELPGASYRLEDLFTEAQRCTVRVLAQDRFELYARTLDRLAAEDDWLVQSLVRVHYPIPHSMLAAVSLRLDRQLDALLQALEHPDGLQRIARLHAWGRSFGYRPDPWHLLERRIAQLLERRLEALPQALDPAAELTIAGLLLDAAKLLGVEVHPWQTQNAFLRACRRLDAAQSGHAVLREALQVHALRLGLTPQMLPWHDRA